MAIKGQGAQSNPLNKFDRYSHREDEEDSLLQSSKVNFLEVHPKTIVNKVGSPDLFMDYSINPYQGCEHGCSYCYARPTHEFLGYSAGIDFERQIMFKKNAPQLLEKFFQKKNYIPRPILLSGNTDCYQPIESKLKITRQLLELFLAYRHPVSIITKNALILRDIDILKEMSAQHLISVIMSIPTINEDLRRVLEPRTSSTKNKLNAIETLSKNNIPVSAIMAPIIPGLNSEEIFSLLKATSEAGAQDCNYGLVRLNDTVETVFVQWLESFYPDRKEKVLSLIKSVHNGKLGDKSFYSRSEGNGNIAEMIHDSFRVAKKKYFKDIQKPLLDYSNFTGSKSQQLRLF